MVKSLSGAPALMRLFDGFVINKYTVKRSVPSYSYSETLSQAIENCKSIKELQNYFSYPMLLSE